MQYVWLPALGGLDKNIPIADFEKGIEDVIRYSRSFRVCLMCSERDHQKCHRFLLLQPALKESGVKKIIHI